jgi:hypothetical protein
LIRTNSDFKWKVEAILSSPTESEVEAILSSPTKSEVEAILSSSTESDVHSVYAPVVESLFCHLSAGLAVISCVVSMICHFLQDFKSVDV